MGSLANVIVGLGDGQVLEMINNSHYLYRMTVLTTISMLAPVVGADITCQTMLPVVVNASKDRFGMAHLENEMGASVVV